MSLLGMIPHNNLIDKMLVHPALDRIVALGATQYYVHIKSVVYPSCFWGEGSLMSCSHTPWGYNDFYGTESESAGTNASAPHRRAN